MCACKSKNVHENLCSINTYYFTVETISILWCLMYFCTWTFIRKLDKTKQQTKYEYVIISYDVKKVRCVNCKSILWVFQFRWLEKWPQPCLLTWIPQGAGRRLWWFILCSFPPQHCWNNQKRTKRRWRCQTSPTDVW